MAAPFVFYSDNWIMRASKHEEPADLVWVCNNCVILMYLNNSTLTQQWSWLL